jgi:ectoine hydroxylase-related dioxygenase (phytanoyl-CoA dioxygenase family)
MLTQAQVDEFREVGFIVVKGLIPDDMREPLRASLEQVIAKVKANPAAYRTRYVGKEGSDIWGVGDVFQPDLFEQSFANYLGSDPLLDAIGSILGKEMRFWGGHALWSPDHETYDLIWHRDGDDETYFDPTGYTTHVQFNSALGPDNSFRAVAGSHRRPLTDEERAVIRKGTGPLPGEVVGYCEPGDVLLMNAMAVHRGMSAPNAGRRTLHFNLQPKDEPKGGGSTRTWMLEPDFLPKFPPRAQELFRNLIAFDEAHGKEPTSGKPKAKEY